MFDNTEQRAVPAAIRQHPAAGQHAAQSDHRAGGGRSSAARRAPMFTSIDSGSAQSNMRNVTLGPTDGDKVAIPVASRRAKQSWSTAPTACKDGATVLLPGDKAARGQRCQHGFGRMRSGQREGQAWRASPSSAERRTAAGRAVILVSRSRVMGAAMNPSRPFHPSTCRDIASDDRDHARWHSSAIGYLPLSALPEVDYPTIQVQTFLPGASPEVMTTTVTAPLEAQFGQMPGLKEMTSISSGGASVITLQFDLSLSLDVAEQEVQAAINAANTPAAAEPARAAGLRQGQSRRRAGADAGDHRQYDAADRRSRTSPTRASRRRSRSSPASVLSRINGGQRPAVRIQANLQALAAYGLNIDDLRTTISNANTDAPKGSFDGAIALLHDQRQRSDPERRRLQEHRRRLQERQSGSSLRCRERHPGRGKHEAFQLDEHDARPSSSTSSASRAPT